MSLDITFTSFSDSSGKPLLVLGPSLGTSVAALWGQVIEQLDGEYAIVGFDLPGHGKSPATLDHFTIADIADEIASHVSHQSDSFIYAGDSVGGTIGLQLMLDHGQQVSRTVLCCTGAQIGDPDAWLERAELVTRSGTATQLDAAVPRWFAPGFADREPAVVARLVESLRTTDSDGYAGVCRALAQFDVRDRLGEIDHEVIAVAGACDQATPVRKIKEIIDGLANGQLVQLDDVAHLAPAEDPTAVANIIRGRLPRRIDQGMAVRRAVLGDAHVDRARTQSTEFTADFQDLITRYAWGEIWRRPGLDRKMRSAITLTALIAGGHWGEFELHLRGAINNGLTPDEIKEIVLQSAIYCSVPSANTAFKVAQQVLAEPLHDGI